MPRKLDVSQAVFDAIEASYYVAPDAPGFNQDELIEILAELDFRAGEITDALKSLQAKVRWGANGIQFATDEIPIFLNQHMLQFEGDPRNWDVFAFVQETLQSLAKEKGLARAKVGISEMMLEGEKRSFARHDLLMAVHGLPLMKLARIDSQTNAIELTKQGVGWRLLNEPSPMSPSARPHFEKLLAAANRVRAKRDPEVRWAHLRADMAKLPTGTRLSFDECIVLKDICAHFSDTGEPSSLDDVIRRHSELEVRTIANSTLVAQNLLHVRSDTRVLPSLRALRQFSDLFGRLFLLANDALRTAREFWDRKDVTVPLSALNSQAKLVRPGASVPVEVKQLGLLIEAMSLIPVLVPSSAGRVEIRDDIRKLSTVVQLVEHQLRSEALASTALTGRTANGHESVDAPSGVLAASGSEERAVQGTRVAHDKEREMANSNASIGWLHLTDLHIGSKLGTPLWGNMAQEFFADLEYLHDQSGPWDLVFFTGDLVQRGSPDEFQMLQRDVLVPLWQRLERLGSKPLLVPVPGNHDLQRPPAGDPEVLALAHYAEKPIRGGIHISDLLYDEKGQKYREAISKAFEPYTAWLSQQPIAHEWKKGIFPGEFCWTQRLKGVRISVIGLNTAIIHLNDSFGEGHLALQAAQFQHVVPEPLRWAEETDVRVLLTHHPISWLAPDDLDSFRVDIAPSDRFTIHMHGHMHAANSSVARITGGSYRHTLQGASLLGLEWLDLQRKLERIQGYSSGRFDLVDGRVVTRVWPRVMRRVGDGAARMGPDLYYDLDRRHQCYVEPRGAPLTFSGPTNIADHRPFDDVDWRGIIKSASTLELVTNYGDSWIQANLEGLTQLVTRGGSVRVLLPDPNDSVCISVLQLRYPEFAASEDLNTLLKKVTSTASRMLRMRDRLNVGDRIQVAFSSSPPSYWALRVDGRTLYFSPFEYHRAEKVQAPVMTINVSSGAAKQFWDKEFAPGSEWLATSAESIDAPSSGRPAARVQQFSSRSVLYDKVAELVQGAQSRIYDTSWGIVPEPHDALEEDTYLRRYRNAIADVCRARKVRYREIIGGGHEERLNRARRLQAALIEGSPQGAYEPRVVNLPPKLPMLEFIAVDRVRVVISGIGADEDVFLLVEGGAFPALLSDYLKRVWKAGEDLKST